MPQLPSGRQIALMPTPLDNLLKEGRHFGNIHKVLRALYGLRVPLIAAVNGPAIGLGCDLACLGDIRIASDKAKFGVTFLKLGIIPAVISPYVIAAIGERYSRRYMLTAERFSASEAYRIGLVHEIVPDEAGLDEAVGEVVDALLKNGPRAQGECKALIRVVAGQPIDDATIEETALRITRVRASAEGKEGLTAFLEKRKPSWLGGV